MNPKLLFLLSTLILWTACRGQVTDKHQPTPPLKAQLTIGNPVNELGKSIMVTYQDRSGVYWFGSWETGVYRYNGKSLVNYTTQHGLPYNRIDAIQEDQQGNIYFTSCHPTSTISKFDGKTFTTMQATLSNDWQLNPDDMWFKHAYQQEKVYRYDGTTLHELQLPKPPNLPNPFEIYSIYRDQKGNIWFGTNPVGVCRYDGHAFDWITEEDVTEFRNEGANGVRSITEDRHGDFWFNTENRYSIYDSATLQGPSFYSRHESIGPLDGKDNSPLDEYLSSVKDNNGNLWFVTYRDGVWKYDGADITHFPVQLDGEDITLFSIYLDKNGGLWLGSHDHGAFRWDGQNFVAFKS